MFLLRCLKDSGSNTKKQKQIKEQNNPNRKLSVVIFMTHQDQIMLNFWRTKVFIFFLSFFFSVRKPVDKPKLQLTSDC